MTGGDFRRARGFTVFLSHFATRGSVNPTGHLKVGPIDYKFILKYGGKLMNGLNPTGVRFPLGSVHILSKYGVLPGTAGGRKTTS